MVDRLFDREQRATHGLAWLATYVESVRQLAAYAERMHAGGSLGEIEELLVQIGIGEYLAQIAGGIPMSQGEIVRPADIGLSSAAVAERMAGPLQGLIASGNVERRARLVELMRAHHDATVGDCGLDETLDDDPRRDAQVRRQRGHAARARMASQQQLHPARRASRRCPSSACSASPSPRNMAAWASARNRCASSPRSFRAAISGSARSARAPRSPPS